MRMAAAIKRTCSATRWLAAPPCSGVQLPALAAPLPPSPLPGRRGPRSALLSLRRALQLLQGRNVTGLGGEGAVRSEITGPRLGSLSEKRQPFVGGRSGKLQTHRRSAIAAALAARQAAPTPL